MLVLWGGEGVCRVSELSTAVERKTRLNEREKVGVYESKETKIKIKYRGVTTEISKLNNKV